MKKIFPVFSFIVIVVFLGQISVNAQSSSKLVELCNGVAGEDVTFIKDFPIELAAAGADGKNPEQKYTMLLSKNTEYMFTVCNAEGSEGKAILRLFDLTKTYVNTYNDATGQFYKSVKFQCGKTGAYHMSVSFLDGKKGTAVTIVSFVRTL